MPLATWLRRLSVAIAISGLAGHAYAQDACQLSLSETLLDFGQMNRGTQNDSAPLRLLGERRLRISFNCPQPADLSLFYRALAANTQRLQFTGQGSYEMEVSDGVVDGKSVDLGLLPANDQAPVTSGAVLQWLPGHGIAPVQGGSVLMGKSLSMQLKITAWADAAATHLKDAATWETSGTLHGPRSDRTRDLVLRAHFAPVACAPQLSNAGLVDYGTLLAKDLNVTTETPLPSRTLQLSVSCDAATRFALKMHDNRHGSATGGTDETAYGLDVDNSQNKIGRYYMSIDPTEFTADAFTALYRTDSTSGGAAWSNANSRQIAMATRSVMGFTDTAGSTLGPVAIQNLAGMVHVRVYLAPAQSLDLRNVVHLNGSGTLEIIYL